MAVRKIFIVNSNEIKEENVDFKYYAGFALSQKQKCIESLHSEISKKYSGKVLEISSKSQEEIGVKLSAFNLKIKIDGRLFSVENIYQSSKVFERGGPYEDILYIDASRAKSDFRIKNSGRLTSFRFKNKEFPIYPQTLFYDWIYCKTLHANKELSGRVIEYDIFTDIEFNHKKSINSQARSAAIYVFLYRKGLLGTALKNIRLFEKLAYKQTDIDSFYAQQSFWDS